MNLRDRMIRSALAVSEYRASDPKKLPLFRSLLGPGSWDLAHPFTCTRDSSGNYHTTGVSTCGLVAAGLLGQVVRLPWAGEQYWRFSTPYHALDIVSCLTLLGQQTACLRPPGWRPTPGDVVCIGSGLSTHVFTVVEDYGSGIASVDGGAVDDAAHGFLQRIKLARRQWPGPRVVWVMDLEMLEARLGTLVWSEPPWLSTVGGVQFALRRLEFDPGPLDGLMGPKTQAGIKSFQNASNLSSTGIADALTRSALLTSLGEGGFIDREVTHQPTPGSAP